MGWPKIRNKDICSNRATIRKSRCCNRRWLSPKWQMSGGRGICSR